MIINGTNNAYSQNVYQTNKANNRYVKDAINDTPAKATSASTSNSAVELSISEEG